MRRTTSTILGVLLSVLVAQDATAQWNVARFDKDQNRMYTTFGLDPAVVGTLGFGRVIQITGQNFQFTGDVGVAAADMDVDDFRARIGAQTSVLHWRSLHLTASATVIARGTENLIYRGFNWGTDVAGTFGVYRKVWFAAGEVGFDKAIITHLTHSDWYRENVYADAKDGWYLTGGGTWRYGATAGVALGSMEIVARAGLLSTERFNKLMPPAYGSLGVGLRY